MRPLQLALAMLVVSCVCGCHTQSIQANNALACHVNISEIKKTSESAEVTVELMWRSSRGDVDKGDVRVVFLFGPPELPILDPVMLEIRRSVTINFPNETVWRMLSGLVFTMEDGTTQKAALLMFGIRDTAGVNLLTSGKFTFPIPIQDENRLTGQPSILGDGILSVAVFKADDPNQEFKNPNYTQLSNVATRHMHLQKDRPGDEVPVVR